MVSTIRSLAETRAVGPWLFLLACLSALRGFGGSEMTGTAWGVYSSIIHCGVSYGEAGKGATRSIQAFICQVLLCVRCMVGLVEDRMTATAMVKEEPVSTVD